VDCPRSRAGRRNKELQLSLIRSEVQDAAPRRVPGEPNAKCCARAGRAAGFVYFALPPNAVPCSSCVPNATAVSGIAATVAGSRRVGVSGARPIAAISKVRKGASTTATVNGTTARVTDHGSISIACSALSSCEPDPALPSAPPQPAPPLPIRLAAGFVAARDASSIRFRLFHAGGEARTMSLPGCVRRSTVADAIWPSVARRQLLNTQSLTQANARGASTTAAVSRTETTRGKTAAVTRRPRRP
jgi:hypothetical protein